MAFQNLANPTDIKLRHFTGALTNLTAANVQNNSKSQTWLVKSCIIENTDNTYEGDVAVNVSWVDVLAATEDYLCYNVWIPYGTSLTIINDSLPIYLDYSQQIRILNAEGVQLHYNISIATIAS